MKKITKIVLIVGALIILFIIGLNIYAKLNQKVEAPGFEDYYVELAKQCEKKTNFSCCIASVRAMENGNYKLSDDNTCSDGFTPNMMKCIDTFKWCEPTKK